MKKLFFLLAILNGIALGVNAQNGILTEKKCDSIEIEAIYPGLFTVIDIDNESYERIYESKKRRTVIRDSVFIRLILDSIKATPLIRKMDGIDVRGKIGCYLSRGEKVVFYIGQWSMQFKDDIFRAPYYLFELLYIPFKEDNKGICE